MAYLVARSVHLRKLLFYTDLYQYMRKWMKIKTLFFSTYFVQLRLVYFCSVFVCTSLQFSQFSPKDQGLQLILSEYNFQQFQKKSLSDKRRFLIKRCNVLLVRSLCYANQQFILLEVNVDTGYCNKMHLQFSSQKLTGCSFCFTLCIFEIIQ